MNRYLLYYVIGFISFCGLTTSCKKKEGCTNVQASNYNSDADKNDGSCEYYLLLWTDRAHDPIEIYIDSVFQDSLINHRIDTVVTCLETQNLFKKAFIGGTYILNAKMGPFIDWSDTIQLDGNCHKIKLELPN